MARVGALRKAASRYAALTTMTSSEQTRIRLLEAELEAKEFIAADLRAQVASLCSARASACHSPVSPPFFDAESVASAQTRTLARSRERELSDTQQRLAASLSEAREGRARAEAARSAAAAALVAAESALERERAEWRAERGASSKREAAAAAAAAETQRRLAAISARYSRDIAEVKPR